MTDSPRHSDTSPSMPLSEIGVARKDRMLRELLGEMHRVHSGRRARRRAAVLITPVLALGLAVLVWRWSPQSVAPSPNQGTIAKGPVSAPKITAPPTVAQVPVAIITMIRTPADGLDAYRVTTASHSIDAEMLDDAELLATLSSLNRPTGLVRSGDRVWLTRNVADL